MRHNPQQQHLGQVEDCKDIEQALKFKTITTIYMPENSNNAFRQLRILVQEIHDFCERIFSPLNDGDLSEAEASPADTEEEDRSGSPRTVVEKCKRERDAEEDAVTALLQLQYEPRRIRRLLLQYFNALQLCGEAWFIEAQSIYPDRPDVVAWIENSISTRNDQINWLVFSPNIADALFLIGEYGEFLDNVEKIISNLSPAKQVKVDEDPPPPSLRPGS
jgi:hypothetical protein